MHVGADPKRDKVPSSRMVPHGNAPSPTAETGTVNAISMLLKESVNCAVNLMAAVKLEVAVVLETMAANVGVVTLVTETV
jgi:hypothetical protein